MNAADNGASPLTQSREIPAEIPKPSQFVIPGPGSRVLLVSLADSVTTGREWGWNMLGWLRTQRRIPIWTAAAAALVLVTGVGSAAAGAASGPGAAGPWRITTLAGGVGGPGPASQIAGGECAVTFAGGYLYATGYSYAPSVIRRISMRTGALTTPVGSAFTAPGAAADGTPAARASIARSCGVTTDAHGNLFFTDQSDLVEMVPATTGSYFGQSMTAGHVYIIGGSGTDGHSGDGGPAVDAKLSIPAGVTVDPAGNVIFDDSNNDVLRIIAAASGTFYSQAMTAGDIYTVAGGGSDYAHGGIPATSALLELENAGGEYPGVMPWPLVAEDQAGNIVLDDGGADGEALVEVVAGRTGTFYGQAMTAGDIYLIGGTGRKAASGVPARQATFGMSSGVAVDHAGNILVADAANHRLDVIAVKAGRFYGRAMKAEYAYRLAGNGKEGLAGDGGPATRAEFSGPDGVTVDSAGNIVLADGQGGGFDSQFDNGRLRVVAARAGTYYGVKMKAGDIYTISGARGHSYYGDGGPADRALLDTTELFGNEPADTGMAASRSGGAVFADLVNNRIRIVPAVTGTYYGRRLRAGDIYTIAGNGHPGYAAGPGTRAELRTPAGVALDSAGNAVLADAGNNRVRVVAARSGRFYGRAMTAGDIYTLAGTGRAGYSGNGGPATAARLSRPEGIAVDHHGNLVVADAGNGKLRVIATRSGRYYGRAMRAGRIYTVASIPCAGVAVDAAGNVVAGCGTKVEVLAVRTGQFYGQHMVAGRIYVIAAGTASAVLAADGVAVDHAGNVIIANPSTSTFPVSGVVQAIAARTGTFYGVSMTAGHLYTIAGGGSSGGLGDGGPALQGRFYQPAGVAVAPSGALFVLDLNRIRVLHT